ncbi:hypothetical protein [Shewanella waksmanii]|uniref:hypothetical protein n=1 Tax=Shewanella waksmanii TaxID=213783 RepID=UPI000490A526|nr:hypothetical protein [Shewanella waksmanii]
MVGLDALYSILAKPVQTQLRKKRIVEQTDDTAGISADSHEAPQSQLPPNLERRKNTEDRRGDARGDRRGQAERDEQMRRMQAEAAKKPLPTIDIDV